MTFWIFLVNANLVYIFVPLDEVDDSRYDFAYDNVSCFFSSVRDHAILAIGDYLGHVDLENPHRFEEKDFVTLIEKVFRIQ